MRVKSNIIALVLLVICACGSASPTAGSHPEAQAAGALAANRHKHQAVMVSPATLTLAPGDAQQFSTTVTGGGTVSWNASLGTIDASGLYTAPAQEGTDMVVAAIAGTNVQAAATVTIASASGLLLTPSTVTLAPGATRQFVARGGDGDTVTWSASLGTIDTTGLYTAPAQAGADTIVAAAGPLLASATVTVTDAGTGSCVGDGAELEAACVGSGGWGNALSATFGRIDGTLIAIAKPSDTQCDQANSTHFILEVSMNGAAYPLVINVEDAKGATPDVYFAETDAPLFGGSWQEGWHTTGEMLDYVSVLNVHSAAFQHYAESDLVNTILCELAAGDKVSIYALGWGIDGAHDIHRNTGGGGADGAVVLNAASANPHYLLFRFGNQSF